VKTGQELNKILTKTLQKPYKNFTKTLQEHYKKNLTRTKTL
jgi:hypothetical protein